MRFVCFSSLGSIKTFIISPSMIVTNENRLTADLQKRYSYYPRSAYVGISSNPNARLWADLRVLTNTFISNTNMEFTPMLSIRKDSIANVYAGIGVNFNLI